MSETLEPESRTDLLLKLFVHLVGHKTCTGYVIALTDGKVKTITCLTCGRTSFNANDIRDKYCGACHVFHDDVPRGTPDTAGPVGPVGPVGP